MQESFVFFTICAFLVVVFGVSVSAAIKGNDAARYFLWTWALLLVAALPFVARTSARISSLAAGLMLLFFVYVMYLMNKRGVERLEASHEETRKVLAESNNRIDEERREISRRLHDDVNPSLILSRNEVERLMSLIKDNEKASQIAKQVVVMINETYKTTRDIIKNTRIEVIDSIGFTAALESLVAHYTDFFDKPAIKLDHDLPKRPDIDESVAVNAYKIIREAVFNAIKHANAKLVTVTIRNDGDNYRVVICDDGVGVKARSGNGQESSGIGLIDMRERARVLGATLKIQPNIAGETKRPGTKVSFVFSGRAR